jgi:hypothetical protein
VSGNGVHETKDCHEAIALYAVQAITLTYKKTNPWKKPLRW